MKLKLERPIVFFDLEATGLSISRDRIIEISMVKVLPTGEEVVYTRRVNPEMAIPRESTSIHGIEDKDVVGSQTFREIAPEVAAFIQGCDLGGYNLNKFDIPLLAEEFQRAGVDFDLHQCKSVDVQTIFYKKEPRTLVAAYKHYCNKDLKDAHSAAGDTLATYEVLQAQLDLYDDIENNTDFLARFTSYNNNVDFSGVMIFNSAGKEVFNIGKFKGKIVEDVFNRNPEYFDWICKGDFTHDTKAMARRIYNRVRDEKKRLKPDKELDMDKLDALKEKFAKK